MTDFERYREMVLAGVSDESILTLAGEGDMRNLWAILRTRGKDALRIAISKALSRIERERTGGKNPEEWTVAPHNLLKEVFACTVERYPCPG